MLEHRLRAPGNTHSRLLAAAIACVLAAIGTACSASSTSTTTTVPTQAAQAAVANGATPSKTDVKVSSGSAGLARPTIHVWLI